ncbi:MAG: NPCBM/NEW2 domain-containing protein [Fibrobacteres bacterium]|nr:NPCBM/NEW2 domain-containing protein [Fibrobacterota bacterium]
MLVLSIPAYDQVNVSDLPWIRSTSYIDTAHRDKNVAGDTISIEGVKYSKGIGVGAFCDNNTYSDVVIDISGKGYDLFAAYGGLRRY